MTIEDHSTDDKFNLVFSRDRTQTLIPRATTSQAFDLIRKRKRNNRIALITISLGFVSALLYPVITIFVL
jgi:hypothetical protein